MDITLRPAKLSGSIEAISSKSQVHRLLILSAFANSPTHLIVRGTGRDVDATVRCLQAMGAQICGEEHGYLIRPVEHIPFSADLYCGESGSTLRFLLPVVGALGINGTFHLEGRLPERPLSPLWEEMERMGCKLSRPTPNTILCTGKLRPGKYTITGNISSQFISGLMLASPLIDGPSELDITGPISSAPYIRMTQAALDKFSPKLKSPGYIRAEGDWSNGAFFLAASALGNSVTVTGLDTCSTQGDRAVTDLLSQLEEHCMIDADDIPDLVPVLSIVAAAKKGAIFTGIRRLRTKESDRIASVISMVRSLGGCAEADDDHLIIHGTGLTGGIVDSCNDHRIAMSAAIAASVCKTNVTILGAECVEKSYPGFWEDYSQSGGIYEQCLR